MKTRIRLAALLLMLGIGLAFFGIPSGLSASVRELVLLTLLAGLLGMAGSFASLRQRRKRRDVPLTGASLTAPLTWGGVEDDRSVQVEFDGAVLSPFLGLGLLIGRGVFDGAVSAEGILYIAWAAGSWMGIRKFLEKQDAG